MKRQFKTQISLLFVFSLTALALGATDTGPFSIEVQPIRITPNSQGGTAEITLRSSTPQASRPSLADVKLPNPPAAAITIGDKPIDDPNPQPNSWRYKIEIAGLPLSGTTEQRYAVVTYGKGDTQTIQYLITNTAANFSWSISKLPEPWVASNWLREPMCTEFAVTPKDSPATNVVLGTSTLVEQTTKKGVSAEQFSLCKIDNGCRVDEPINLSANLPSRLRICTKEGLSGNFHGAVTLASMQKPDGDTLFQTASFSSALSKCVALAILCAGIYLAWWSKVWARGRLDRDQSLIPTTIMRAQVSALQAILDGLQPAYKSAPANILRLLQGLSTDLSDSTLDGLHFLPPSFPSPHGYTVDAAGYKAYLESRNPTVQLLSILVKEGVAKAATKDNGSMTAAQQKLIVGAIGSIDAISANAPLPSADQAFGLIQPILTNLQNTLFPPLANQPAGIAAPSSPPASRLETLQLQIQSISKGVWLLYGVLTALTGVAVLILNNPGFGVPLDFVFSFFWGFGLPTTIGTLAPGSSATALNINIATG